MSSDPMDCAIIGGGPAGLTAALYLARYNRRFAVFDGGASRAAWIPESHNLPLFTQGIGGPEILRRQRDHVQNYGGAIIDGEAKWGRQRGLRPTFITTSEIELRKRAAPRSSSRRPGPPRSYAFLKRKTKDLPLWD